MNENVYKFDFSVILFNLFDIFRFIEIHLVINLQQKQKKKSISFDCIAYGQKTAAEQ